jgi:hypothetical protein
VGFTFGFGRHAHRASTCYNGLVLGYASICSICIHVAVFSALYASPLPGYSVHGSICLQNCLLASSLLLVLVVHAPHSHFKSMSLSLLLYLLGLFHFHYQRLCPLEHFVVLIHLPLFNNVDLLLCLLALSQFGSVQTFAAPTIPCIQFLHVSHLFPCHFMCH